MRSLFRYAMLTGLLLPVLGSAFTPITLSPGWNLVGNSDHAPIDVATRYGGAAITTVWKWNKVVNKWAFYTPSLTTAELASYAQSKGYDVLGSIESKEGFWVNAKTAATISDPLAPPPAAGTVVALVAADVAMGWNLLASAEKKTPSQLSSAMRCSLAADGKAISTLWSWDASTSAWKFYAPSLEAQGGTALSDFIAGKKYQPSSAVLAETEGFWVNAVAAAVAPVWLVKVHNAADLTAALAAAEPGHCIQLAAGSYPGNFRIKGKSGTADAPISIQGTDAVLSSPVVATGFGLHLEAVHHIIIDRITIVGSQKGLVLDASSYCRLQNLTISGTGMEAVHFRKSSRFNTLQDSTIHTTGLHDPIYGEGVYIGSSYNNWSSLMLGADTPDDSSDNLIFHNTIGPLVRSEAIDVKEGTQRNRLVSNSIDSRGIRTIDSAIDIKGDATQVINNTIVHTPTFADNFLVDGIQAHPNTVAGITYGKGNLFSGNIIDLNATVNTAEFIALPKTGYAINIVGAASGTVCTNNQVKHGLLLSNVPTTVCP